MISRQQLLGVVFWASVLLALVGCSLSPTVPAAISSSTAGPSPSALPSGNEVATTPIQLPSPSPLVPQSTSTSVPSMVPYASPTSVPTRTATAVPASFSGAAAYFHVKYLAEQIGSRPGGSAAFADAASYIGSQLEHSGYTVQRQPYSVTVFQERSTRLTLSRPQEAEVAAKALVYSAGASAQGQLAYCGLGRPTDFPAAGVQGKIVLLDRGMIPFQNKIDIAEARGAAAVIVANDRSGELKAALSRPAGIPVVSILQTDGQKLLEFIRQGTTVVSVDVEASNTTRQDQNVVASLRPASDRKQVIIGAHYDSVAAGPGANDNGSGVATLLELARVTSGRTFSFDITFVAFGDEEMGLVGSRRYVDTISRADRLRTSAMVNFDMVGVGTTMEFGGDKGLAGQTIQIAQRLGYRTQDLSLKAGQSSDYASFTDAGIPSVFFYRSDDPNYHTSLDTADRVKTADLEAAGSVALRLLENLSRAN